jgi:hypothetical protein
MHADPLCEVGCPYAVRGFDFDYHRGALAERSRLARKDELARRVLRTCTTRASIAAWAQPAPNEITRAGARDDFGPRSRRRTEYC